jgi:hypothetical protein
MAGNKQVFSSILIQIVNQQESGAITFERQTDAIFATSELV